jgi:hypothetical protein
MQMKTLMTAAALASSVSGAILPPAEAATLQRVQFESHGQRLVGDLYLPNRPKPGKRLPAIVVTGAWTTVKEQMPGRYAAELADRGYAALAFDFRGWGQSEGSPRQEEKPERKTEDIMAAAAYLVSRPDIDADRIGGLGVCASAGYLAGAAIRSQHLRSIAFVAPWLHDSELAEQIYGGAAKVTDLLATSDRASTRFATTGEATLVVSASMTDSSALMFQIPYYNERPRGQIPEWTNQFNVSSWRPWLTFDALAIAPSLSKPFAMVMSDAAALPKSARQFYAATRGDKRELWIDNASQFDFYDAGPVVKRSADFVVEHFRRTLD